MVCHLLDSDLLKINSIMLSRILPNQLTFNLSTVKLIYIIFFSVMANDYTSNKIDYRRGSFTIMKCATIIKAQEVLKS